MKVTIFFLAVMAAGILQAQIFEPVEWDTAVERISDTEVELIATATIDKGWHLYSQSVPKGGPSPTSFSFEGNSSYLKKGNTAEEEGHTVNDPIFKMRIKYFADKATFRQRIKVRNTEPFQINGTVTFMVCDNSKCLPPTTEDLVFKVN
ncbi:protein-disulfide reductase DsbD domain-containing protein [Maribacter sp. X9]|uniref:protein-disulfide reductase DsbD domain-containing protein n=1 Tax=Maribacter sp. X9 TaxID=3402159 RepID=UPI003AF38F0A